MIDRLLSPIADKISGIIFSSVTINGVKVEFLVALLMCAAIYFTFRTRFIGIWGFKHGLKLIMNKFKHQDNFVRKKKVVPEGGSSKVFNKALAASVEKLVGLSPQGLPFESLSQKIKTLW